MCFSGSGSLISSVGCRSRLNRSGWIGGSVAGVNELATMPTAPLIVSSPNPSNGLVRRVCLSACWVGLFSNTGGLATSDILRVV